MTNEEMDKLMARQAERLASRPALPPELQTPKPPPPGPPRQGADDLEVLSQNIMVAASAAERIRLRSEDAVTCAAALRIVSGLLRDEILCDRCYSTADKPFSGCTEAIHTKKKALIS